MGRYNPRGPGILGEEWVGIRDENTVFSPTVNLVEYGHNFEVDETVTLQDARFYVNEMPPNISDFTFVSAIYPRGRTNESGPVRKVVIPVETIATTGWTYSGPAGAQVRTINSPGFGNYFITGSSADQQIALQFNTSAYSALLTGKRILNVSLLLGAHNIMDWDNGSLGPLIYLSDSLVVSSGINYDDSSTMTRGNNTPYSPTPYRVSFGNIFRGWSTFSLPTPPEILPWSYTDLARMDPASGSKIYATILTGTSWGMNNPSSLGGSDTVYVWYAALEVTFCEEQRLYVGGRIFDRESVNGVQVITMRDIARTLTPSMPAGDYVITLSAADEGSRFAGGGGKVGYPNINAVRQLNAIPTHTGVQVNITLNEGETFETVETDVLTQLSLHAPAFTIGEVHSYGRVTAGQVYGTNYVEQTVFDNFAQSASYDQIRFYARRFGNTTQPLRVAVSGPPAASFLDVATFDALPEIIDGWKEITLTLSPPGVYGTNTVPLVHIGSDAETKGNRWEVLGVSAPAISGISGDMLNLVTSPQTLTGTTYGDIIARETWMDGGAAGPYVNTPTVDPPSDVVVMFSELLPAITGHGVTQETQALTSFTECGATPCCTPTALTYNRVTWVRPPTFADLLDTFGRTVVSGWGSADTGQAWTLEEGTASDVSVASGEGIVSDSGSSHWLSINTGSANQTVTWQWRMPALPTGGGVAEIDFHVRMTDTNNSYYVRMDVSATGVVTLVLRKRVAGVSTSIGNTLTMPFTVAAGQPYVTWIQVVGNTIRMNVWNPALPVPPGYFDTMDTAVTTGTRTGVDMASTSTTLPFLFNFDELRVSSTVPGMFGAYELQRWDTATDWQTIMRATDKSLTSFNDYEARVDTPSVYRIRVVNELNFNGPWSTQITGTVPTPGVTLPSCGASKRGMLIFTSNEAQDGAHNLAYAMTWDGDVSETFSFPEASDVVLTKQHARDFQLATHGTERGGEVFSRQLLLSNAAVALPRLANARSLREMAWADLPYVCVRDDIGDRWFATVIVPNDVARHNRRLYNANITVVETTATASPVDP